MISGWQKTWRRLSQMSWDELHTRVGQEINKRLDLIRPRAGHHWVGSRLGTFSGSASEFFFSANELNVRVALLRQYLPAEVEQTIADADDICHHRFNLLGYEKLDYGPLMDWHLDAVHGKRAPLKPWYKIDFLRFSEVGDHKITWELNRHQHLVTLAKAWCLTEDARYPSELSEQWYSWQQANPYPMGINWASSLEVALRSLSWLWVLNLIDGCASLAKTFRTDLVRALGLNAHHIERYLSTYFSPNTHLLGEALALFFIGTLCPQIADADRWRETGWQILLQEATRQVHADGVYFEQALYYHVYALDFFLHARILASRNGIAIPADFDTVVEQMLDVVEALSEAGPAEGFGDDDGGRLFNPRRNRTEHMTDPLAIGAGVYGKESIIRAAKLTEEAIWLLGARAIEPLSQPRARPEVCSRNFVAGGIYILAGVEPWPQQLMIDGGPQGTGRCGHGHADALSVRLTMSGRRYLIDSGTGCYLSENHDRELLRGTAAHNTLRVDGLDQAVSAGPFAWTSIPKVKAERWLCGKTFDLFVGSHDGYCRLEDPVVHRRSILRLQNGLCVIRDLVEGRSVHRLEAFWHFAADCEIREEGQAVIAASIGEAGDEPTTRLALLVDEKSSWSKEIALGLFSPAYGVKLSAPVVRIAASVELPVECATMLAPLEQAAHPGQFAEIRELNRGNVRAYRHESGDKTHYFFYAEPGRAWTLGPWASDAELLCCGIEHGQLSYLVLLAGSWARCLDKTVVSHHCPVERFEWFTRQGRIQTSSSDDRALEYLLEGDLECLDSVL